VLVWVVPPREDRVRVRCVDDGGWREVCVARVRPSSSSVVLTYGWFVIGDVTELGGL